MRTRGFALVGMAFLSMALFGCDSFSVLGVFKRTNGLTLTLQKSTVQQGETIVLYPAGGTPPYSFGVVESDIYYHGTLGLVTSEQYTAGTDIGTVLIHLVDSAGFSVDAPVVTIPPTPAGFSAAPDASPSPHAIDLAWSYPNASMISGFEIQQSVDNVTFTNLVSLPSSATTYVDSPLTPSQMYYYRMYASAGSYQSLLTAVEGTPPS